jgi:hypothetical protein
MKQKLGQKYKIKQNKEACNEVGQGKQVCIGVGQDKQVWLETR